MRCKNCEYPLWNLKARSCPECGTEFQPSDHQFVANSVRFCCPSCDQDYYGTSATGHLDPPAFDCVQCGRSLTMDEMVLRPAEGVAEQQTRIHVMPWLERAEGGFVKSWLRTVGRSMVAPGRLMRAVPAGSPVTDAWWYAIVTIGIILMCGGGVPFLGVGIALLVGGGSDAAGFLIGAVSIVLGGTTVFLLAILIWGAVIQGLLLVTGGTGQSLGRTYQALCYGIGTNVTSAVPCIGLYPFFQIGLIWWFVAATIMVYVAHRVSGPRASFATLSLPLLAVVLGGSGFVGLMFFSVNQARMSAMNAVSMQQELEMQTVTDGLLAYASGADDAWPVHAVELVRQQTGGVTPWDFVSAGSATYLPNVPIAGATMETLAGAPDDRQGAMLDAVTAAQLPAVTAHRLGDFVFCYHGIDRSAGDVELWISILSPDPDRNEERAVRGFVIVGKLGGTVESIAVAEFDGRLAAQNRLRAKNGMPEIPAPGGITHATPALGP